MSGYNALFPPTSVLPRPMPDLAKELPSDPEAVAHAVAAVAALIANNPRRPILHIQPVNVPALARGQAIELPATYQRVQFYFPTTPNVVIGPNSPSLPVTFKGVVTLPGTTNLYMVDNLGAAAVSFVVIAVNDLDPLDFISLL